MSEYWSDGVAEIEPYVPGEQPRDQKYVKLNTNENPYPPSPKVLEAIKAAVDSSMRLYPDPTCEVLRTAIAARFSIPKTRIFMGNGSDEVLAFAFAAFLGHEEPLLCPDISYSFYPVYAKFFRLRCRTIAVKSDFSIPVDEFLIPNGGIVLANPNAPTGKFLPLDQIRRLLDYNLARKRVVLVDEAYVEFGGESASPLTAEYPNLLVVHTLSKSKSLAGLRVGFALGQEELIAGLERIKSSINSYTLDRLALAGATAAFADESYYRETRRKVLATRAWATERLEALGFIVLPSSANFVFISHKSLPAERIYAELKAKGILVRYFRKPRIDNYLRVSIGTDEEMKILIERLGEILG
ncbi:MAG: histidinol-phosphate transaminase [Spirochaetes bacterium]|nr:histidinol-phosphate transaminase [Spirochaetota bacterium]